MIKVKTYSAAGIKKPETALPKRFESDINEDLIAQAVRVYEWDSHADVARTKTRSEISITKTKLYRQKGTGRARHDAKSAPIFVGGAKAHGPKGIKRQVVLNKKIRIRALDSVLSLKAKNKEVVVVEQIGSLTKTKAAQKLVDVISKDTDNRRYTFALSEEAKDAVKFLRNLESVDVFRYQDLNAYIAYFGGTLVLDKGVLGKVNSTNKKSKVVDSKKVVKKGK